jgi:hypothetical protein
MVMNSPTNAPMRPAGTIVFIRDARLLTSK